MALCDTSAVTSTSLSISFVALNSEIPRRGEAQVHIAIAHCNCCKKKKKINFVMFIAKLAVLVPFWLLAVELPGSLPPVSLSELKSELPKSPADSNRDEVAQYESPPSA